MVPRAIYTGNRMKLTGISDATINKYILKNALIFIAWYMDTVHFAIQKLVCQLVFIQITGCTRLRMIFILCNHKKVISEMF